MSPDVALISNLGDRIAACRARLGWTQAELSERLAISRVALANLESGRSVPSERTVVLLAGVFDMEPHQLVAGTSYPPQKSDRLPLIAARYTEVDLELSLLDRDLEWLARIESPAAMREVLEEWRQRLSGLSRTVFEPRSRAQVDEAQRRVGRLISGAASTP